MSGNGDREMIARLTAPIRDGFVPAHIYNDADVHRLEVDRLFSRAWVFLAHESEIPQLNDFVVRNVVDDSFLVTRDTRSFTDAVIELLPQTRTDLEHFDEVA